MKFRAILFLTCIINISLVAELSQKQHRLVKHWGKELEILTDCAKRHNRSEEGKIMKESVQELIDDTCKRLKEVVDETSPHDVFFALENINHDKKSMKNSAAKIACEQCDICGTTL